MKSSSALLFASTILLSSPVAAAGPNVVASIKPVHSLVASIMQGVGEPSLIVEGAASPHTYNMKPSNAAALQAAKVVFWVGPGLEAFLDKPLDALSGGAKVVELSEAPGLEKLKFREGGAFEAHDHDDEGHGEEGHKHAEGEAEHDDAAAPEAAAADDHDHAHEGHDHEGFDMHLWLDPQNARAMAAEIEKTLTEADPDNAGAYKANLEKLNQRLDALDKSLVATVAPVKDKPFVVFHDAYQYFEHRYQVRVAGSITVSPEVLPGADRLSQIHAKIKELGATCVFAEPQFEPKLINVVIEGTPAKSGTLDPEAATLDAGPDLYFQLMEGIGTSLKTCLASAS
ncbi:MULTISPECIES: zinc ABC transporter substrate-binding protein ZnuA [Ensifer]|jgi:zinc transport system substrate-binding protein|uniref:High-affinity zinc uptake system protein ZnuA n=1 Tax=Ensifer canadensis TaxID=555315 RepID=A0AAW4FPZ6_9HYPH|nr:MULTISPECIES: zinc ABC transporter substrate-binding protein ZnuA [Ensifer]AHK44600.1 high-affinity zinc uptake system protein ZnuA precursor [Ensifer adhaerens OV14]MDP9630762.1 zinc transport system substrate-binding protein [Ensifer adhaerens]KQU86127.1 zinc transporter [Ensifer sp. Root31]KQW58789.1 zinc transporter [Ensifer sp. Root1252]KQW74494.1 zinc transporter [Ensifer sp. Root127]